MRADIHDGPEPNTLQSEAGYIDARPQSRQIDENLLRRTAGPYIGVTSYRSSGANDIGQAKPTLAVFKLITSSSFLDCTIGLQRTAHVWSHSSGRGRKLSSCRAFSLEAPRRRVE